MMFSPTKFCIVIIILIEGRTGDIKASESNLKDEKHENECKEKG